MCDNACISCYGLPQLVSLSCMHFLNRPSTGKKLNSQLRKEPTRANITLVLYTRFASSYSLTHQFDIIMYKAFMLATMYQYGSQRFIIFYRFVSV